MDQQFDILIRNARLRSNKDQHFDIGVKNGRITAIAEQLPPAASHEIDARRKSCDGVLRELASPPRQSLYARPGGGEFPQQYHNAGVGNVMTIIEEASRV